MRSICLSVFAFTLFAPAALAQNSNPFAEWDSLKKNTELKTGQEASRTDLPVREKPETAAAVKYFTPDASAAEALAAKLSASSAAATAPRKERLKTATTAAASATDPSTKAAGVARSADSGRVTVATFSDDQQAADSESVIRQAADSIGNPFAEFIPEVTSIEQSAEALVSEQTTPTEPAAQDTPQPRTTSPTNNRDRLPAAVSGPQSPTVSLSWEHHDELSVGQQCRCDLVVQNSGQTLVQNVLTDVQVPAGLQVIRAEPEPTALAGNAQWKIDSLSPGEEQRIRLVVVPREQGDVQLNAYVQLTSAVSSSQAVTQPKVAIKLEGPATVEVGQQLAYTVHVTNPGTGTARNVTIQAAVPEGLEHRQGRLLNIDIGTLNPGELRRARLSLTAVTGGAHELAVRVVADGGLNKNSVQQVSVAEPKLNIGLRGPASTKTGQSGVYELVVVNEGNVDSNNVRTKYKVPAGFHFESADAGGKYNPQERTIEWFLGTLEPNQVRQFKVSLRATEAGTRQHQVGVISEHGRMTMADHETAIEGFADLKLHVAATDAETQAGAENVVTVTIENAGSSAANSVGLSCELPPGLELVDISGPSEFIADSGVIIFRKLPEVQAGAVVEFQIRTRCERPGAHRVRARVASQSIREPLIGEGSIVGR